MFYSIQKTGIFIKKEIQISNIISPLFIELIDATHYSNTIIYLIDIKKEYDINDCK